MRDLLKRIPGARSAVYLGMAIGQMAGDRWRKPRSFDSIFSESQDPWATTTSASEAERFAVTFEVLDSSLHDRFEDVVELGCAEGIFTERLAPRCDHIDALDFSEVALERARTRLAGHSGITFRRWDMRRDPLKKSYDLVVAMGVLTSLYRPYDVRRVRDKIIGAMRPGAFMLFSDVRQSLVFEDAWWGKYFLRGGEQIRRLLSSDSRLEKIKSADTATHVFALYRKT
jgi:2-polyprenyl-3-methyl-5-hydroxy-6-metoxy-1,4-benzoquinol methylase